MNDAEEVKSRLDIVEVIGSYVVLKPAGQNFKALSPFKSERTPSFIVSPQKNIWHDFSSGEGGDVISFVMKMEGMSFVEALEMLARRAGVTLKKRSNNSGSDNRTRLYDLVDGAVIYYHLQLSKSAEALSYLKQDRGLNSETIKKFKLGYSSDRWDDLSKYLLNKGYSEKELIMSGLSARSLKQQTSLYDVFRDRIMFPIYDNQNRAVGFSARILSKNSKLAKYINTKQTPIFNKSAAIYGFSIAKDSIRSSGEALLVEGNMDVIGLSQAGITNVVAVSGTALTATQLKTIAYLAPTIYICFDNDEAGALASRRAIELAAQNSINIKVIDLHDGKDPDEIARSDIDAFKKYFKDAQYGMDYLISKNEEKYNTKTAVGKKNFISDLAPLIAQLVDPVEQDHYIKKLSSLLDINERALREKISTSSTHPAQLQDIHPSSKQEDAPTISLAQTIEKNILELALPFEQNRIALQEIDEKFISVEHRELFKLLRSRAELTIEQIVKLLPNQADYVNIMTLRGEEKYKTLTDSQRRIECFTQVHHLRALQLKAIRSDLSAQLADAEKQGEVKKRDQILSKIQETLNEDV